MEQVIPVTSIPMSGIPSVEPNAVWTYLKNQGASAQKEVWTNQLESMSFTANTNLERRLKRMPTLHERPPQARSFHSRFHKRNAPVARDGGEGGEGGENEAVIAAPEDDGNFRSGPRRAGGGAAGGGAADAADGSWRTVKPRKTPKRRIQRTEFKKDAENDYDRKFIEIRKLLNKLTRINVDEIKGKVQTEFDGLDEVHQMKVFQCIHENAAKQAIFIEQYRCVLNSITANSPEIREILNKFQSHFASIYVVQKRMEDVDYREDYEAFCDLNEMKEKRKGLSQFFGNCMTEGLGNRDVQMMTLGKLCDIVEELTVAVGEDANMRADLEERVDCLQSIVKPFWEKREESEEFMGAYTLVNTRMTELREKQGRGIPAKARFKMMDISEGKFA